MLTEDMKAAIERTEIFPFATASSSGIPNVIPIRYLRVAGDDQIWITDNYLLKTLANLEENPLAAFYVWSQEPKLGFQVKGRIRIQREGADYERMKESVRRQKPDLPARALLVLQVSEVYQCLPGADAGKRLLP